jgi:signal transduction histidine kinase
MRDHNRTAPTVLWWALVVAAVLLAFAFDVLIFPEYSMPIVYVPAIILGYMRLSSRSLVAIVLACTVLNLVGMLEGHMPSRGWIAQYVSFVATCYFVIIATIRREELCTEQRDIEMTVKSVERLRQPLTVMLGYSQLLESLAAGQERTAKAARAIRRAALDTRAILSQILRDTALPGPPVR